MGFLDLQSGPPSGLMLTKVFHPADPRSNNVKFDTSQEKEIRGLF